MFKRILNLTPVKKSFFLWGPRQTGKSSLLKSTFPHTTYFDLLRSDEFLRLASKPSLLRELLFDHPPEALVIIDEIQKIPALLDEVHYLIEAKKILFALCGSSARKLKRGHGNLLGGRAHRQELLGLSAIELGEAFDLIKILNRGYLPSHYLEDDFHRSLESYVGDYLKEEIFAEGLSRSMPSFSRFLEVAATGDTEILNFSNIARETHYSSKTVQSYYEILTDTLVGEFLPAYTKKLKRRTRQSPKFYFHDVGVVNFLAQRKNISFKTSEFGKAFENWIFHEIQCFFKYSHCNEPLSYWQLTTGVEVDFILGDMQVAIECKGSSSIEPHHLKNLRELKADFKDIQKRIVVCLEKSPRKTEDGILILPYPDFLNQLWSRELIQP